MPQMLQPRWSEVASTTPIENIWDAVRAIPRGRACAYGEVARLANLPGRARLVGHALKAASGTVDLPWHRVVGAGGKISFPEHSAARLEQQRRLRAEGVIVTRGRVRRDYLITADDL